jgi:hypothetical protein
MYSPHAKWCPTCYTDGGHLKIISSAIELPAIGDTWVDETAGDRVQIVGVSANGATVVLELADGSCVEIEASALVSLPDTVAPEALA